MKDDNQNPAIDSHSFSEAIIQLQGQNEARMDAQEKHLARLYENLESVFAKIHQDTGKRDASNHSTFDELSSTIIRSSEEMRKEYEEMERLQEKRIAADRQQYNHSIKRTKIIAIRRWYWLSLPLFTCFTPCTSWKEP